MNRPFVSFISLLFLLHSFQGYSFQSLDQLLADPDITWVGEVYVDYHPTANFTNPHSKKTKDLHQSLDYNNVQTLKSKHNVVANQLEMIPNSLSKKIFELDASILNVYKDSTLKEKLSYQAYQELIQQKVKYVYNQMDLETYEDKVGFPKISKYDIHQFRLKQLLSYNSKTNQLKITPLAIAPLINIDDKYPREKVLFWMPVNETFKLVNLDDSSINWAKRFYNDFYTNTIKTVKGKKNLSDIFIDMITKYEENPSTAQVYQANYYGQLEAFPEKGLQTISRQIDTLITLDANLEKTVTVVDKKLEAKDFAKIRIVQDWVWDERTQTMQIQVLGFSPLRFFFDRPYYKYYSDFYIKAGE